MTTPGSDPSPPTRPATGPDPAGASAAPRSAGPRPTTASHSLPTDVLSGNWPGQAADLVVDTVDKVRDKTTGPIQTAARGLVYGIVALVLGTMVAVLLIVGAVRLLDAVQPWGNVWLPYLELGVVFLGVGIFLFRRRRLGED